jgi:hypothetical protein
LSKPVEELLQSLPRKFYAKLMRAAQECKAEPATILNQGIDLYRKQYRLMNGPIGQRLNDAEKLETYSLLQSVVGRIAAQRRTPEARAALALAGARARAEKIKKQKLALAKKPSGS